MLNPLIQDVGKMWECFKEILIEGINQFIPHVKPFASHNSNWKIPLGRELRQKIKVMTHTWGPMDPMHDKTVNFLYWP